MKKTTVGVGIAGIALGAVIGTNVSRYFVHQHERTTAVMVLLELHLKKLEFAVQAKNCVNVESEVRTLRNLADEIAVVLPMADAQDAVFHQHVKAMRETLSASTLTQCALSIKELKQVRNVCDECHQDYR